MSSSCEEKDLVSEELKSIYHLGEVRLVENVNLSVDVVEKIVANISSKNINKVGEVRKPFSEN